MFIEDKLADMRESVIIELQEIDEHRREADSFSISFQWTDPQKTAMVANRLAALFIIEDFKEREAEAVDTTQFLDEQLREIRERLKEYETRLGTYRKKYMGELPEQLESNLRILDNLQRQLSEGENRLRDEKNRLALLIDDIKATQDSLAAGSTVLSEDGGAMTLLQLKNQLADLQTSYTERHPDVIRLKAKIADMEAKLKSGELQTVAGANTNTAYTQEQFLSSKILGDQIRQQSETRAEINNLEEDIRKLKFQVSIYQQRIERTPKREEELMTLNRDYENIQASYSSLMNRKLEAEVAVNMEKKQKGEQFSIIQTAEVPRDPLSPNLKALFIFAFMISISFGSGLIFLLDYFDISLRNPDEFESDLGVPVLATIPKIYQKKDFRIKWLNRVLTGLSLLVAVCLLAGFAVLVLNGVEPTLEIVRPYIEIVRPYFAILKI
jgi:polysaccharide chain length determinant protein (PEP-CTERM system associated)